MSVSKEPAAHRILVTTTQYSFVFEKSAVFRVEDPEDGGIKFVWNVTNHLPDYHSITSQKSAAFVVENLVDGDIKFLWNVGKHLLDYTASHARKQVFWVKVQVRLCCRWVE